MRRAKEVRIERWRRQLAQVDSVLPADGRRPARLPHDHTTAADGWQSHVDVSDEELLAVARHAELAHVVIELALQDVRVH
jgi:hypothetical protein